MIFIEKKKDIRAAEGCEKSVRLAALDEGVFLEEGGRPRPAGMAPAGKPERNKARRKIFLPPENDPSKSKASVGNEERAKSAEDAFRAVLRILAAGPNSSRMLKEKLRRKGFSQETAEEAVERARKARLFNDRLLLIAHTGYLARKKYYGKSRIRMALLQKFDRETVEEFFEEAVEEIDFSAQAAALAGRFAGRGEEYLIGRLHRAGYTASEIRAAVAAARKDG